MARQSAVQGDKGWTFPEDFFNEKVESIKPLNREQLAEAEKALDIRFPQSYVEFLLGRNGGYINFTLHPSQEPKRLGLRGSPVPVRGIAGIANGSRCYDIAEMTKDMPEWGVSPEHFVAIDGEGHHWIAFDKQKHNARGEPTIAYVASEQGDASKVSSCTIADDFQSFIEALIYYDDV